MRRSAFTSQSVVLDPTEVVSVQYEVNRKWFKKSHSPDLFCFSLAVCLRSIDTALSSTVAGPSSHAAATAPAVPIRRCYCRDTPHASGADTIWVAVVDIGSGTIGFDGSTIATLHVPLSASVARWQRQGRCYAWVRRTAHDRGRAVGNATYAGSQLEWR